MTQPRLTPNTLHESTVVDFGLALAQARNKKGHGLREVARQVGLDRERLREVEEGLLCVDASTFNRIAALYPALRHHAEPLAAARQRAIGPSSPHAPGKPLSAPLGPALAAAMASAPASKPAPAPVAPTSPSAPSAPHPPLRVTLERVPDEFRREPFGTILAREREREGMSKSEMARTLGVTRGTIANWELGRFAPTQERYDDLVTVFPSLRRAQPPSKDCVVTWVDAPDVPAPRRVVITPPFKPAPPPPPPPAPKAPAAVPAQLAPSLPPPPPPVPAPAPKEKPMTVPVPPPAAAPSTPFAAAFSLFVHLGAVKRSGDAAAFRAVLETMAKQGISAADALAALEMM